MKKTRASSAQGALDFDDGGRQSTASAQSADDDRARYRPDPADDLLAEEVKPHSRDKYSLLSKYVDICSAVRNKQEGWGGSNCYIDLYSGPGRVRLSDTGLFADGSPLVAWESSRKVKGSRDSRFAQCFIGDDDTTLVDAAGARLKARGAAVHTFYGDANKTVAHVVEQLPRKGFHFAFLDPYSIGALPFTVIEQLASVKTLDILLHFSVMDMRRNMARFISNELPQLDGFAPGWRDVINPVAQGETNVIAVGRYWMQRVHDLGKPPRGVELIRGQTGNELYWLVLLSKSDLAARFFNEVSAMGRQRDLSL